jgi:hypothetical protein
MRRKLQGVGVIGNYEGWAVYCPLYFPPRLAHYVGAAVKLLPQHRRPAGTMRSILVAGAWIFTVRENVI